MCPFLLSLFFTSKSRLFSRVTLRSFLFLSVEIRRAVFYVGQHLCRSLPVSLVFFCIFFVFLRLLFARDLLVTRIRFLLYGVRVTFTSNMSMFSFSE